MALFEKQARGNRDGCGIKQHMCGFETRTLFWRARVWVLTKVKGFVCVVRRSMWGRDVECRRESVDDENEISMREYKYNGDA